MSHFTLPSLVISAPSRRVIHRLRKGNRTGKGLLLITGYDYFLTKRDYKRLLPQYEEVILVPRHTDDEYLLNVILYPILSKYALIHLVANPAYDQQHHQVYQFMVKQSKMIRVSTITDFCEQMLGKVYIAQNAHERTFTNDLPVFRPGIRGLKKGMDVLASIFFLFFTSPFWIWCALRIKQQSPGPVFYRQARVGRKNQEFYCVKFRSMRLDAEVAGAAFSSKKDRRTFTFGAFMRKIRLDELPQFLNVLKGEMSLVGPRPERKVFITSFENQIPHYQTRHQVKPGITGYAQICYPYGAGVKDARHKLMYDLYYIKHWSIRLEAYILWRTVITVITKQGC